jgi:hypothetical protein
MLQAYGDVEKKAGLLRSRLADPPNVQHLSWELFEREPAGKESLHSTVWMLCERGSQHLLKLATNWPRRSRKGTVRKMQRSVLSPASIECCNHLDQGTGANPTIIRFLTARSLNRLQLRAPQTRFRIQSLCSFLMRCPLE